jgi:hypothetical protein
MRSSHWNHERGEYIEGRGVRYIGKRNVLNNFCIGVAGSRESCNKCHVGFGWGDQAFDHAEARNVDCLSCHDTSGSYVKKAGGSGYPDAGVNLTEVATHVGRPQRVNCGTCHFFSGGGNNVKHGDLEQALFDTTREVDVHMATGGADMSCVDCHSATKHQMKGKLYSPDGQPGEGAFFKDFDVDRAVREGMASVGLPYSGKLGLVETEMTWPVNHMVAPKEQAVGCAECHTRQGSRLAGLKDFYMPGRDAEVA